MGQVFIEKEDLARRERYFCLFLNDFVVVSVGIELVGYCFEVRVAYLCFFSNYLSSFMLCAQYVFDFKIFRKAL